MRRAGPIRPPISAADFYGLSNDAAIPSFDGAGIIPVVPAGQFVELAINLSAAGAIVGCPSSGFVAMNVRTRESDSNTAAIKDYASAPVNIPSNCSQFKIEKRNASGDLLPGATFSISPNPIPLQPDQPPLSVTDGDANDA